MTPAPLTPFFRTRLHAKSTCIIYVDKYVYIYEAWHYMQINVLYML